MTSGQIYINGESAQLSFVLQISTLSEHAHIKADKALIYKLITERGFENYEMHFVGTSDGGYHSLLLAQQFSQTAKYLGINSSHKGPADLQSFVLKDMIFKQKSTPVIDYIPQSEVYRNCGVR